MTIGPQVWIKANYELTQTKDASMAVILSATAIDCELSYLFGKWTGIERLPKLGRLLTDEECEELLLEFRTIQDKFKKIPCLLVPKGFEDFVNTNAEWRDTVSKELPELDASCLIKSIQREVFWRRNRILHGGAPASPGQAELCVRIAKTCLRIFLAMDYERRKRLPS
ncbi:MAG: hypothetical protein WBQ34_11260 [Candidatus Acidiferrales bacterium]